MATRWQRYAQQLSSHPYHSTISSSPSFSLAARDDDADDCLAPPHDSVTDALASPRVPGDLAPGALTASDRFFVSPVLTASIVDDIVTGALASPRVPGDLPPGAVSASDRFFVSPALTASIVDDAGAAQALRGAAGLVETCSCDPRAQGR